MERNLSHIAISAQLREYGRVMIDFKQINTSNDIFMKANALGNDFILIKTSVPATQQHAHDNFSKQRIIEIAERRLGLGADQILSIDDDYTVNIWNADGSIAKMCGNGLRCLGKWIFCDEYHFAHAKHDMQANETNTSIKLKTISGDVYLAPHGDDVKLHMPFKAKIQEHDGVYYVDIGNPHKIHIVSASPKDLSHYADDNYNVSCIWRANDVCNVRTWELGTGETLACGSAAFSIASVLDSLGETDLDIHFKHGTIKHIKEADKSNASGNAIVQIGPATLVGVGVFVR